MAVEQWGFFSVPHLLGHGTSVYNGHLRGPVTFTPVAERLAVELPLPMLPVLTTEVCRDTNYYNTSVCLLVRKARFPDHSSWDLVFCDLDLSCCEFGWCLSVIIKFWTNGSITRMSIILYNSSLKINHYININLIFLNYGNLIQSGCIKRSTGREKSLDLSWHLPLLKWYIKNAYR